MYTAASAFAWDSRGTSAVAFDSARDLRKHERKRFRAEPEDRRSPGRDSPKRVSPTGRTVIAGESRGEPIARHPRHEFLTTTRVATTARHEPAPARVIVTFYS